MSRTCSMMRLGAPALLLFLLGGAGAQAAKLTFSPSPAAAGEPITATFESVARACDTEGLLQVESVVGKVIRLEVSPPGCPFTPSGFLDYTVSTALGPLAAGTYTVYVLAPGGTDPVLAREVLDVKEPPVCTVTETSLCLGGRFEVTGDWIDFAGGQGPAKVVPDDFGGLGNFGVLWFFSEDNPEVTVKVLDGCSFNGYYWVFLSPASTVEYHISVRDVRTGHERLYGSPLGKLPSLIADTRAFSCAEP